MRYEIIHLAERFDFLRNDPTLELYLPYNMTEMNRQNQKRPVMLVIPGGAYGMVSQREGEPVALHFLTEGFNVLVLKYSVAPNRFPTQIVEVAAAMEVIYANAEAWNCDTERIAVMGFSAGGHLAAHYSNAYDCPQVREVFPESKPVKASVLCYPVISADPAHYHGGSFENLTGHLPLTEEETIQFSCDKLVTEKTPPAFLWHTSEDDVVPVNNSLLYAQALSRYQIPYELHIYPFGGHGLATADKHTNHEIPDNVAVAQNWLPMVKTWLKAILK